MEGSRDAPAPKPAHTGDVVPRGIHHLALTTDEVSPDIVRQLSRVVELDPGFGTAWALLSRSQSRTRG